jgi:galactonate dehydratase
MKITDIKTFLVDSYRTNFTFVKVFTDEGITGVGEGTLEYKERTVAAAVEDCRDYLIGKNPLEVEKHSFMLYRESYWRVGPVLQSALSAIETALWDIVGKYHNMPIMELFGGPVREEIKFYANAWFVGAKKPDEFAGFAKKAVARGVKALKWDPFGQSYLTMEPVDFHQAIDCVAAVREAVGQNVDLLIEGHGRFDIATALQSARAIEPYNPMFFEEPVPPDNFEALAQVRRKSPVPIAAGERIYSLQTFADFLSKECVDIAQPDLSHCGGIGAAKKMAAMCEASYVGFAPHNPCGPVSNAATLQIAGCTTNFRILEITMTDVTWRPELTNEEVVFHEGNIVLPRKPGLGLEINEEACLKHPYRQVALRHYNGNLTNIRPPDAAATYFTNF